MRMRFIATLAAAAALLSACATRPMAPGSTREELLARWGEPSAVYALPEGRSQIEYATGPYGRTTWMVDIDAAGRVVQTRQVLNEAEFRAAQVAADRSSDGLSREELLLRLGTPGERRSGGYQGGQVWSWRYPTNDCLWFEFSVSDSGRATRGAFAIDPRCDAPPDGKP